MSNIECEVCEAMYSALYIAIIRSLTYFCAYDLLYHGTLSHFVTITLARQYTLLITVN